MRATVMWLAENRLAERFPASKDAEVEAVGDDVYPAVLMDVSERGFRAMVDGHLHAGGQVRLAADSETMLDARVVWVKGTVVGCEFIDAIGPERVAGLLRRGMSEERGGIELYLDGGV